MPGMPGSAPGRRTNPSGTAGESAAEEVVITWAMAIELKQLLVAHYLWGHIDESVKLWIGHHLRGEQERQRIEFSHYRMLKKQQKQLEEEKLKEKEKKKKEGGGGGGCEG